MFKKNLFCAVLIALITTGLIAQTQTAPTAAQLAQMDVQRYAIILGLSSTQQQEALTIFTTEQVTLEPIRKAEKLAHDMLATAIKGNDATTLTQVSSALGELKGQSILAESVAKTQLYLLLTTDQQAKFATLLNSDGAQAGAGMFGVFGMAGGPPPRR